MAGDVIKQASRGQIIFGCLGCDEELKFYSTGHENCVVLHSELSSSGLY